MIIPVRLFLFAFIGLTILYFYLSIRQRWRCRRRLEAEFDAGGVNGSREDYVAQGMRAYEHSLRRGLVLGVYIVPLAGIVAMIYIMNFM